MTNENKLINFIENNLKEFVESLIDKEVKLNRKNDVNLIKSPFKIGLPIIFPSLINLLGHTTA